MDASHSTLRKRSKKRHESDTAVVQHDHKARVEGDAGEIKETLAETVELWRDKVHKHQRRFYATRRFLFPLGVLLGILVGFILIQPNDLTDFQTHLALLLDEFEFDLSLPQLPQFDLSVVESEWRRLRNNIPEPWKLNTNGLEFTVGEELAKRGLSSKHPVVLVPGIISTGLESWSTTPEYRPFFRQKMWGGFSMISQVMFNRDKWMNAIMLDPVTGLDPPGAKVRAAEGIEAASSFIQGYWLWSKIVENLAVVNYDTNNLHLAPYDWRLSYYNLEVRDGYFSKLKATIEGFKQRHDRRVVLVAHSMGCTVMLYFFKWVEAPGYGNGGADWVENHIEALVSIAGTHLGVAKAMTAFLSGEMRDTVQMNPAGAYVLERFFSRKERRKLFHSWSGSASMWIKGGDAVWGNATFAPDDLGEKDHTHGELVAFRQDIATIDAARTGDIDVQNMTANDVSTWILQRTPSYFQRMVATNYSYGIERDKEVLKRNGLDHTKWTNPLEVQLPHAPTTKLFCVYGHGKETERSYWYTRGANEYDEVQPDASDPGPVCTNTSDCQTPLILPLNMPLARRSWIDAEYTDNSAKPRVMNGVKMGEGDGTVNLLSLGAMCVEGWKRKRWNPAGMKVVTIEIPHRPVTTIPRGGGTSSDHVDILGNIALNEIILKVATGAEAEVRDAYVSNIRDYARRVQWD